MRTQGTGNSVRQRVTRVLAAGALLFMYAFGMVATTGAFVAAGVSPAFAQRGRGGGAGRRLRAVVEVAVSAQRSASASAQPSSAARSQRAPPSSSGSDAVSYCMQRYRSYDPKSMTYLGHDGIRRPCP